MTVVLPLGDVVDIAKETDRLQREVRKVDGEVTRYQKKLANHQFLAKAPADVVEDQKERLDEAVLARAKLTAALERLAGG